MSDMTGNPEDRFSCIPANIKAVDAFSLTRICTFVILKNKKLSREISAQDICLVKDEKFK